MSLAASDRSKQPDNRTTMELGKVLPKTAEVKDGHLFIGGVDMVELAKREGTALYVFDEADLEDRMRTFRSAFESRYPNSGIIFASKAFQNKEMVRLLAREGLYMDSSGGGELACALACGYDPKGVFLHGNNKTERELREAIGAGVGRIIIDSRIELARISRIAGELGVTQPIYMRITPGVEADTHDYIITGSEDSKFGFTVGADDFAFRCVADVLATPNVELVGFHCHIGSQIFDLSPFREAAFIMVEFMARVNREYGLSLDELDLGGGLGIAYVADDDPPSIDDFAEMTTAAVRDACAEYGMPLPQLFVEPGRSLVANPGVTLYTIGIMKTLPNIRKYVAIDGGMSDNIRTALYGASYEPVIANKADQPRTEIITLCGKHCESGDVVVVDMPIQKPEVGDIVCVFCTGAYCYTMSSTYNGQPRPAIVFVKDGEARVVTRRETYEDLMARDL